MSSSLFTTGEELAYSYGLAYWETFADQTLDIEYSEMQQREVERLKETLERSEAEQMKLKQSVAKLNIKLRKSEAIIRRLQAISLAKPLRKAEEAVPVEAADLTRSPTLPQVQ